MPDKPIGIHETIGIAPEALRIELPPVPDWFRRELSQIGTINGHAEFRIVNGQTETCYRNGKTDIKHLFQTANFPCYVPVIRESFVRYNESDKEVRVYPTYQEAKADRSPLLLPDIRISRKIETRAVGRPCWIVEVYVSPQEINEKAWNQMRYSYQEKFGVKQRIDTLGPYPRDGKYIYCFSVIDEEGRAIAPNQRTLDECKRRWMLINEPQKSLDQSIKDVEDGMEAFEAKTTKRLADNVYQYHGIAMRKYHYGRVGKPILTIKEGTTFYDKN